MKSSRAILARRWVRRASAALALAASGWTFFGCQGSGPSQEVAAAIRPPENRPASLNCGSLVLPGEPLAAWERSASAAPGFARFEYSRNDSRLNLVFREPLRAEATWLEPVAPFERPVRFRRWEQK